ncbi:MAG: ATPase domain-containing protein [Nitrososphaerales archaeon]
MLPRITSCIPGVDDLLNGGFPEQRCIVLQGGPGSGKTTFALQFIYEGAVKEEQPGIYITLSESPDEIRENNKASHGWDLAELEKKGILKIVDARPVIASREGLITPNERLFKGELLPFSHLLQLTVQSINKAKAKRLALDSLTVLTMQYANRFYVRQGVLGLIQALSSLDCTSLLLVEDLAEEKGLPIELAIAPGAIVLRYERKGDVMTRSFQILKMRGVKHSLQFYHMEIDDSGIRVFPEEAAMSK